MLQTVLLLSALAAQAPAPPTPAYTPEQLATGTVRSIISAEALYKQTHPAEGYGCDIEALVRADMLAEVLSAGKEFNGYVFKVWCETKSTPQATFRAAGVPTTKGKGASHTVCTDESNAVRTVDGDAAACFAKGVPAK